MSDWVPSGSDYLWNPDSGFNFRYNQPLSIDLPETVTQFKNEKLSPNGSVINRQFSVGGMFGGMAYKNGAATELVHSIESYLKQCMLDNYDELGIGRSGQRNTGMLRQSIEQSSVRADQQLDAYRFRLSIADISRQRPWGNPTSTLQYGKLIVKGRAAITQERPMAFPGYGMWSGNLIRSRYVSGVEPKDFTKLDDEQKRHIAGLILPKRFAQDIVEAINS